MKILSASLPNIPWQDAPDNDAVVWRHTQNPVIGRNPVPGIASVYNSAVVPYEGGFIGIFRAENRRYITRLHLGRSTDGVTWDVEPEPISWTNRFPDQQPVVKAYDPRICLIDGQYVITWCHGRHGATIGMGSTTDFKTFTYMGDAFLPFNRNGVLFPKKINGKFAMLSRPSDNGHTPFGDIFYSDSPDLDYWGRHRHVMGSGTGPWELIKIGPGPVPIETDEGWLLFYHGVRGLCNGYIYSMGAALLDRDEPWKVIARCREFLLTPEEPYETTGVTSNVIFPCAALTDSNTGRIAIYYGCADTVLGMAYTTVEKTIAYIKSHPLD